MTVALYSFLGVCLLTLIGWLVVTRNAHTLAIQRDRDNREHAAATAKEGRKRAFRADINSLRDGILAESDGKLFEAHKTSLTRFRNLCHKIEMDIPDLAGFKAARDSYLSLTLADIECRDKSDQRPTFTRPGEGLFWQQPCRYHLGRSRIKELLDRIHDLAQ